MQPVIQEDRTGCALASVAALACTSYSDAKRAATDLGISVDDPSLWSATAQVRKLLRHFNLAAPPREQAFHSWKQLPERALLAIKWHREKNGPAWHWVVFVREGGESYVLDPKKTLRTNRRKDFGRMRPKWFIAVTAPSPRI
ncbi:MAG: hypothetical protein ABIV50_13800 [Opitutus sp.]